MNSGLYSVAARFSAYEAYNFLKTGCIDFGVDSLGERVIKHYTPDEIDTFLSRFQIFNSARSSSTFWEENCDIAPTVTTIANYTYSFRGVSGKDTLPMSFISSQTMRDLFYDVDTTTAASCCYVTCNMRYVSLKTALKWKKQCETHYGVPFDLIQQIEIRYGNDLKEITSIDPTSIDYQTMVAQQLSILHRIR